MPGASLSPPGVVNSAELGSYSPQLWKVSLSSKRLKFYYYARSFVLCLYNDGYGILSFFEATSTAGLSNSFLSSTESFYVGFIPTLIYLDLRLILSSKSCFVRKISGSPSSSIFSTSSVARISAQKASLISNRSSDLLRQVGGGILLIPFCESFSVVVYFSRFGAQTQQIGMFYLC